MAASGPELIVTTPRGQSHELGALMAAVVAASDGWKVVYLSPNMPANEIAAMVLKRQARVVVLGISYPADDPHLADELRTLRSHLPEEVAIVAGGAACEGYSAALDDIDAETITSFSDFRTLLRRIRST
jgi:methylmalonyl-CoA mutase cobalamin-binding subunit